jgi:hypothetical protein
MGGSGHSRFAAPARSLMSPAEDLERSQPHLMIGSPWRWRPGTRRCGSGPPAGSRSRSAGSPWRSWLPRSPWCPSSVAEGSDSDGTDRRQDQHVAGSGYHALSVLCRVLTGSRRRSVRRGRDTCVSPPEVATQWAAGGDHARCHRLISTHFTGPRMSSNKNLFESPQAAAVYKHRLINSEGRP